VDAVRVGNRTWNVMDGHVLFPGRENGYCLLLQPEGTPEERSSASQLHQEQRDVKNMCVPSGATRIKACD
jgi:hypothetical protein